MNQKRKDRIFVGLVLLLIGGYYLLKYAGINLDPFLGGWWWVFVACIGIWKVIVNRRYFGGFLLIGIGLIFYLSVHSIISSAITFPLILVLLGILFLIFPKKE